MFTDFTNIPTDGAADQPTFSVYSDGQAIPSSISVSSLMVRLELNRIPTARLILFDGDPSEKDFKLSGAKFFRPGKTIEIKAGYRHDDVSIFEGVIIKHGLKARKTSAPELVVELKDPAIKMCLGRKNAYFADQTDRTIIEDIAGAYGLNVDGEDTSVEHPHMVQFNVSDWDFILSRAEKNALLVQVANGELQLLKPDLNQEPVLKAVYGTNIYAFDSEVDARNQYKDVLATSWDYSSQKIAPPDAASGGGLGGVAQGAASAAQSAAGQAVAAVSNVASAIGLDTSILDALDPISQEDLANVFGIEPYKMIHGGSLAEQELQAWVDALKLKSDLAFQRGRVLVQGTSDVKPGTVIELDGLGVNFKGKVFVTAVSHQINDTNWETDIQFGLCHEWFTHEADILDTPAGGLVPAVCGLQIGIVTQIEADPDSEFRVKVRMPIVNDADDGVWARWASLDAGEDRGVFFMPEVDDEVVLGFFNDDPRDPVVLGMLHSTKRKAPFTVTKDNTEKGFVTKSGIRLVFNDTDGKASITMETPDGHLISLTDEDKTIAITDISGNKIEMSDSGITIESVSDLNLTAQGNVNIEAQGNIASSATGNYTAEGTGGIDLSSSATASLSGAIVQIN